LAITI
jgi:hypothetical protein